MARMRVMREGDLGDFVPEVPALFDPPDSRLVKLRALIRSSEIKGVIANGLGKRIEPGMGDKQTAGAQVVQFYMIDCRKADEILNA